MPFEQIARVLDVRAVCQFARKNQMEGAEFNAEQAIIVMENIAIIVLVLRKERQRVRAAMEKGIATNVLLAMDWTQVIINAMNAQAHHLEQMESHAKK